MGRTGNIITATVMWCAIAAYGVAATMHARDRRAATQVRNLRIAITDTAGSRVITAEKVRRWLAEEDIETTGRSIDSADTRTIEKRLATRCEVRHVSAWTDLEGNLTVRLEPRLPAMRVRGGGYRFWFTRDGFILADRGEFTAHVPVVTGSVPWPFPPSAEGNYAKMQADNYNDFLERFAELEARRRTLTEEMATTRAKIRTIRTSQPKRWWSRNRKLTFAEGKKMRIAELENRRRETTASLEQNAGMVRTLAEKEKKSYQSHRFLSKLANFVEFIGSDRFWAAQIVQIHVVEGERAHAEGEWREPQLELIPRAGDHTILLGEIDGTERQRLENLRLFYLKGLRHEGWREYGYINIKYSNQIVCTK